MARLLRSALLVMSIAGFASADLLLSSDQVTSLQSQGYGVYLGSFAGNDNEIQDLQDVEQQINQSVYYTGEDIDLAFYSKVDAFATEDPGLMTLTYDIGNLTGTWATSESIDFYTVKGSKQYTIWWVNDGRTIGGTSGKWTTEGLLNNGGNQPAISHLSTWNDQSASVPEPTTTALLGISLLLLGFLPKRKKR